MTGRASATMGAMNKRELAKAVAVQSDVELKTVIAVLDGFTDVVTAVVAKGVEPVSIPGFAKFVKVDRPARMGRNPATGEAIRIKASKKARITPVKAFKDAVLAPAKAPKLARGAYPTVDTAVAAAGKSTAPAPAKKAPAKRRRPRRPPPPAGLRRRRPRRHGAPGQEGHDDQAGDQEVARSAPSRAGAGRARLGSHERTGRRRRRPAGAAVPAARRSPARGPSLLRTDRPGARRGPPRRCGHLRRPGIGAGRPDGGVPRPARLLLRDRMPALPVPRVSQGDPEARPVCSLLHRAHGTGTVTA